MARWLATPITREPLSSDPAPFSIPRPGQFQPSLPDTIQRLNSKFGVTLLAAIALLCSGCQSITEPPHNPLTRKELAIIVNTEDPLSIAIGDYYQQRRGIPDEQRIEIAFPRHKTSLSKQQFQQLQQAVELQAPAQTQAYALTWAQPYRVECMSITAAFSFGFDESHCAEGCAATAPNPYFNAVGDRKPTDYGMRLTMAIAATRFHHATALINRGALAQGRSKRGTAYLASTLDRARNVRALFYPGLKDLLSPLARREKIAIQTVKSDEMRDRPDVMFYFTGGQHIPHIHSNRYLPGAMADHLTSFGGMLTDSSQMSSLRWLEAGATGSYGTVAEPCNFQQKFPHPTLAMGHYLRGDTLIEAYWKSVAWPGQGIFIGDPLAQPFR